MKALLQAQKISKSFGARTLLSEASFAVNEGEHIGVIGPNGAGKTTLFKILIGEESTDSGELVRSQGLRLGYLAQHEQSGARTVQEHAVSGSLMPEWEIKNLALGLGLSAEQWERPLSELSGGYRMRCHLVRLLAQQPNLLLLDEPTNYLDLETLLVLERFLMGYGGAFLLISHDREFLKRTTDHILEVESGDIVKFPGSIDDYFEQKEMLRSQLEARALSVESKKKEILDFVARFGAKASKARQAQSRLKSLDRLEKVEVKAAPVQARVRIPSPERVSKLAFEMKNGAAGYPGRVILRNMNFQILGGDRVGVVGLNGAGKTTLLRSIAGELGLVEGALERGYGLESAYFGQIVPERLDPRMTVYEALNAVTDARTSPQEILDMAGSLLFSGDDTKKRISVLSGGEKSRVALGQVLLKRASCLLLDEPTNHLDFYTVEALTQALAVFPGTVITVSHDRSFIARVSTKILEVKNGTAWVYPGTYDDYVWSVMKSGVDVPPVEKKEESPVMRPKSNRGANEKRLKEIRVRTLELDRQLKKRQAEMTQLNEALSLASGPEARRLSEELGQLQKQIEALETEWFTLTEEESSLQ